MESDTTVTITTKGTMGMKGNSGISRILFIIDFCMPYVPFGNGGPTHMGTWRSVTTLGNLSLPAPFDPLNR